MIMLWLRLVLFCNVVVGIVTGVVTVAIVVAFVVVARDIVVVG
jgi:hypothetical protein